MPTRSRRRIAGSRRGVGMAPSSAPPDFRERRAGLRLGIGHGRGGLRPGQCARHARPLRRRDRAATIARWRSGPAWSDAAANRERSRGSRAERREGRPAASHGRHGRQTPDEVVYDKDKKRSGGQETQTTGAPMSDEAVRALWLKRVQTAPGRFPEGALCLPAAGEGRRERVLLALSGVVAVGGASRRRPRSCRTKLKPDVRRGARPACPRAAST